jgi:SAM-dependent methyltransferase
MINTQRWLDGVIDRWQCPPVAETRDSAISLLEQRHGAAGRRFGQLALNPDIDRAELFAAKNDSLSLSLDAAMLWSGELYRKQLPLLATALARTKPASIVDVGCEQGLVTCLVAAASPDSRVVGIDRCHQAVARAAELAVALELRNVRFICADVLGGKPDEGNFDLLIGSRSMLGEALPNCCEPAELLPGELPAADGWQAEAEAAARSLTELLKPDGMALLTERTDSSGLLRWARALATAGLLPTGPHALLQVEEPGGQAGFRMLEFTRRDAGSVPGPEELINQVALPGAGHELTGEAAEAAAIHLEVASTPIAWEWLNSNCDRERIELVSSAEGAFVKLRFSTNGERTLCVHEGSEAAAARERTERFVNASAGANLSPVNSILPRARGKIKP